MKNAKNYLKNIFGKEVSFVDAEKEYANYEALKFKLNDSSKQFALVHFENKLEVRTEKIKQVVLELKNELNAIPVLVFDELRLTQRNALVESRIAFVLPGHQIYIPYTVINLKEKEVKKKTYGDYFSVPTQVVYIFILLNNIKETNARRLAESLDFSVASINRALKELVERGLLETVGSNTRKLYKVNSRTKLWKNGMEFLFNPVAKTYYAGFTFFHEKYSNKYALYKIVNPDSCDNNIRYYGITKELFSRVDPEYLIDEYDLDGSKQYSVLEIFKYNPRWLSKEKYIDPISLYAQFKDSEDEDTLIAVKEMLEKTVGL